MNAAMRSSASPVSSALERGKDVQHIRDGSNISPVSPVTATFRAEGLVDVVN